jgi:hypothetical protein
MLRRLGLVLVVTVAATATGASFASGWWSSPTQAGSAGASKAAALPTGNIPVATAAGSDVTIRWTPTSFSGATLSYALTRYASGGVGGTGTTIACTPTPAGGGQLQCTDSSVPAGTWQYTTTPTLNNWRGGESAGSPAVTTYNDVIAPTTTATPSPAVPGSGWYCTTPVSVTLSASDNIGGSGVAQTKYTLDGSDPQASATAIAYSGAISISSTTTIRYFSRDNAGNFEPPKTLTIQVDSAAPANSLSLTNVSGGAYLAGTSLYYRGVATGSFTLTNAVTDSGGSGPASSAFPALAGAATGWTHGGSTVSTPSGGPYVSSSFSWAAGTTSSPTETVIAADVAGNTTSAATLTLRNDTTAPTSSAAQSPAPNASGWNRTAVTVTLSSSDNVGGSGVQAIKYTTDGTNPTTSGTAQTYTGAFTESSTATIRYAAIDNVGNAEAVKTLAIQIDTVAPVSTFSLSSQSGGSYKSGSTVYYRGAAAGSFRLTNTLADTDSGAASSTTSALTGTTGWTHTPGTVSAPAGGPFVSSAFSWVAGTSSSPGESVTTADNAGNTTTTTLTFVNDSTAPTGAATFPAAATYSSGASWNAGCGTSSVADICGSADDALSGAASVSVTVRRGSDNRCWSGSKWTNCNNPFTPTVTAGASPAWTIAVPCTVDTYTVSVLATDNVGNAIPAPGNQQTATVTSCA